MTGIEQPCFEVFPELCVRHNPLAINLVFERRLVERMCFCIVAKYFQQIVGAKIVHQRFGRMRDLKVGFDTIDVFRPDQIERSILVR